MTVDEARALVTDIQERKVEANLVEVKAAHSGTTGRPLRQSLSAFASRTGGGVVLLGLDEGKDFALVGVHDPQRVQEDVANAASELEPPVRPDITVVELDGRSVVDVEVPETLATQKPCFIRTAGMHNGSYIRVGASNRQMTPYEVFSYASIRDQATFDSAAVPGATIAHLNPDAVARYVERVRRERPRQAALGETDEALLTRVGVLIQSEGDLVPTLAGLLVFGRYPQQFAPQLMITFVQYAGTNASVSSATEARFEDNQQFEGPMPDIVDEAIQRVFTRMRNTSIIRGILREDIPEYPAVAVREAMVNATVHRDYSGFGRGSPIQVRLSDDRLEIRSPGGLFGSVTEETLDEAQSTRNSVLVRLLQDLGYVENRGSGISAMSLAMRNANLEPPIFEDLRTAFKVTFRNHTLMNSEAVAWLNQFSSQAFSERQQLALVFVRQRGRVTNGDYRRLNRVDSPTATRELREMVVAGAIAQQGAYRGAYYTLPLPSQYQLALHQNRDANSDLILDYVRQHGSVRNEHVRELLGVDRARATYLLGRMVDWKMLEPNGSRRWTTYRIPAGPA